MADTKQEKGPDTESKKDEPEKRDPDVGNPEVYDRDKADKVSHDDNANVAKARAGAGQDGSGPLEGRVDGQSRRSGLEVMTGHFCSVDRTAKGVKDTLKEAGASTDRDAYGVFVEAADTDGDGYPDTALVRLRDETNALISVPYSALTPADAGGR